MVVSEATTGVFVDLILMCRMAKGWAKNGVETIILWKKRKDRKSVV